MLGLLVGVLVVLLPSPAAGSLNADYFTAPEILESNRHPLSFSSRSGNIVSAGHFRGVLKQGKKKVCNGMSSCYSMPLTSVKSRGWSDIFLSMYNSSRILQWTITAGGDGDDRARAVNTNIDGDITLTGYITGLRAKFSGLMLSSRSTLSRTIFLAVYSPSGSVRFVKEAASCMIGMCDVSSVSSDETGTVLTGFLMERTTFGTKKVCAADDPSSCIEAEAAVIDQNQISTAGKTFAPKTMSTGSGLSREKHCWVAKYDKTGNLLWARYCEHGSFETDLVAKWKERENTVEQHFWAKKALAFFKTKPESADATGLLGKDTDYASYAQRRVPYGV